MAHRKEECSDSTVPVSVSINYGFHRGWRLLPEMKYQYTVLFLGNKKVLTFSVINLPNFDPDHTLNLAELCNIN
jgi:hypothetical protein